jgi:hypothetical protein
MTGTTSNTKPDTTRYASHLNVLFPPLECVDDPALVAGAAVLSVAVWHRKSAERNGAGRTGGLRAYDDNAVD